MLAAIMGWREARRSLDPPGRRVRGDARHSGADRAGLRGQRAAPPAGGRVDRLRPRRRPRRRVRRAGVRELVPAGAQDRRAGRRRAADGAARRRLRAADRPRLRDRRRARRAVADARAAGARVRARRGAGAADGAGAVGDRRARRWSGSRRRRWPPRPRSRPASPPPCCWPGRRCARSRCASGRGCATCSAARCCSPGCRGWAGRSWPRAWWSRGRWCVWTLRERRRLAALVAGEALAASLVFYATINDRFYGGLTPRSAGLDGAAGPAARLRRAAAAARRAVAGPRGRACCAGRRCSRSCSSPAGCCTARAATSSRASRSRGARPRRAPGCCWPSSARSCSSSRCSRPAGCAARRSRACRWSPRCPRSAALTAWGLRHVPRAARGACWRCSRSAASAWLVLAGARRQPRRAGSTVDTERAVGPAGRRLPGLHRRGAVARAASARCSPRGAARAVVARAPRRGRVAPRGGRLAHLEGAALSTASPRRLPPCCRCTRGGTLAQRVPARSALRGRRPSSSSSPSTRARRAARRRVPRPALAALSPAPQLRRERSRAIDPLPRGGRAARAGARGPRARPRRRASGSATRAPSRTCTPRR